MYMLLFFTTTARISYINFKYSGKWMSNLYCDAHVSFWDTDEIFGMNV